MRVIDDPAEQLLNRAWRPALEITGASGLPPCDRAGNVLRATTSLYLSLRLPPTADPGAVNDALATVLTANPPHGAAASYRATRPPPGGAAPRFEPWLGDSLARASGAAFGRPAQTIGSGGSITFMAMLSSRFPQRPDASPPR
jgi:hypothetical protein